MTISSSRRREVALGDFTGLAAADAIARLRALEMRPAVEGVEADEAGQHGLVLAHEPAATSVVRRAQLVTLLVGQHPRGDAPPPPPARPSRPASAIAPALTGSSAPAVCGQPQPVRDRSETAAAGGEPDEPLASAGLRDPLAAAAAPPVISADVAQPQPVSRSRGGRRRTRRALAGAWTAAAAAVALAAAIPAGPTVRRPRVLRAPAVVVVAHRPSAPISRAAVPPSTLPLAGRPTRPPATHPQAAEARPGGQRPHTSPWSVTATTTPAVPPTAGASAASPPVASARAAPARSDTSPAAATASPQPPVSRSSAAPASTAWTLPPATSSPSMPDPPAGASGLPPSPTGPLPGPPPT